MRAGGSKATRSPAAPIPEIPSDAHNEIHAPGLHLGDERDDVAVFRSPPCSTEGPLWHVSREHISDEDTV